jgi:hypothetical protein
MTDGPKNVSRNPLCRGSCLNFIVRIYQIQILGSRLGLGGTHVSQGHKRVLHVDKACMPQDGMFSHAFLTPFYSLFFVFVWGWEGVQAGLYWEIK